MTGTYWKDKIQGRGMSRMGGTIVEGHMRGSQSEVVFTVGFGVNPRSCQPVMTAFLRRYWEPRIWRRLLGRSESCALYDANPFNSMVLIYLDDALGMCEPFGVLGDNNSRR